MMSDSKEIDGCREDADALDEVLLILGGEAIPEAARPIEVDFVHRGEACDRSALKIKSKIRTEMDHSALCKGD